MSEAVTASSSSTAVANTGEALRVPAVNRVGRVVSGPRESLQCAAVPQSIHDFRLNNQQQGQRSTAASSSKTSGAAASSPGLFSNVIGAMAPSMSGTQGVQPWLSGRSVGSSPRSPAPGFVRRNMEEMPAALSDGGAGTGLDGRNMLPPGATVEENAAGPSTSVSATATPSGRMAAGATGSSKPARSATDRIMQDIQKRESFISARSVKRSTPWHRLLYKLQSRRRKAAPYCRALNKNKIFQLMMLVALICALFLPDFWVLIDRPDNKDLDIVLTVVLAIFIFELVVQSIGLSRTYWGSFFFWTDLLGAASLLLDLSYLGILPNSATGEISVSNNVVIMRAARVAKLGARAGRFTRLVKLLRFLPGMREQGADQGTAKVISARLITALSTRVSCLIIVMVMVMPMFSMWTYPEQDWSMKSWLDILEKTSARHPDRFAAQLEQFGIFYSDMDYFPYEVLARTDEASLPVEVAVALPWTGSREPPHRSANSIKHDSGSLECNFNFKKPNQIDALMNVLLLLVVMVLMVGFSLVLSNSVSAIVLRPLEELLMQVRKMASTIFQSVTDMAVTMREEGEHPTELDDEEGLEAATGSAFGNETQLLEKVVQKLAVLSEITMNKSVVDAETMEGLADGDRAVIHGFQGTVGGPPAGEQQWEAVASGDEEDPNIESMLAAQKAMVENAGLSLDWLNSWNLNPLELDKARNHAAAMYFMGPQNHGMTFDPVIMGAFLEAAEAGYVKTCPYTNWFHAIDVTHCVYRLLHICDAEVFLSSIERYALLVSATCHDVGHPGMNNTFFIETSHELALLYNDRSPLENMHCARLFEFVSIPRCNIFGSMSKQQFQEARKICIEAILHTDNSQHFAMIKELQMMYEVNSEILDASRELYLEDIEEFPTKEAVDCFRQQESRKLLVKLFLHIADVSNSLKPFRICRIWAWQALEEFFLQGDAEKRLHVPVQPLHDREKVNRAFSQVGFIEFLVSPLMFVVVKVLPPLDANVEQMLQNVKTWHQHWLSETKPPPNEADKKALADRVARLESRYREDLPD